MEENKGLKKDIILIVLGALISASTVFVTSTINESRQDKKSNIQKKLELNDQISKDLGKRLYLTYQLYKTVQNKDSSNLNSLSDYRESKEDWNIKVYSYQSLLKHYYSEDIKIEFLDSVYNPLVELGKQVEYKKIDKYFKEKWLVQQRRNIEFVSKIYDLSDQ
jgi:hypothetical protein